MDQAGQSAPRGLNAAVAQEIRVILLRRGWKQMQLAERLGVHEMWVSRRLRGVNAITIDDLDRIADALGVKPVELLGLVEQAATQLNAGSHTVAERSPVGSPTPVAAPITRPPDNRPAGGPHSGQRRPERVFRTPVAA